MFVPLSGLDANRCANVNQRRLLKIMYAQQTLLSLYKPRVPEEDCAVIKQRKVPVLFSLHTFLLACVFTQEEEKGNDTLMAWGETENMPLPEEVIGG